MRNPAAEARLLASIEGVELLDYDERFISSSKDPEKLAAGVKFIFEHPEEMQLIVEKNKDRVVRFYDRDKVFETYGELYRRQTGSSAADVERRESEAG